MMVRRSNCVRFLYIVFTLAYPVLLLGLLGAKHDVGNEKDDTIPDIEVRVIRLVDKEGHVRGSFGIDDDSQAVVLSFLDADENLSLQLAVSGPDQERKSSIAFFDVKSGLPAASIEVFENYQAELAMYDEHNNKRLSLRRRPDGMSGVWLSDDQGRSRVASLCTDDGDSQMIIFNKEEEFAIRFGVTPDGKPSVLLPGQSHVEKKTK